MNLNPNTEIINSLQIGSPASRHKKIVECHTPKKWGLINYYGFMVVDNPLIGCFVSWVALAGLPLHSRHAGFFVDCGLRLPDTILTLAALKNIPKDAWAMTKNRLGGLYTQTLNVWLSGSYSYLHLVNVYGTFTIQMNHSCGWIYHNNGVIWESALPFWVAPARGWDRTNGTWRWSWRRRSSNVVWNRRPSAWAAEGDLKVQWVIFGSQNWYKVGPKNQPISRVK